MWKLEKKEIVLLALYGEYLKRNGRSPHPLQRLQESAPAERSQGYCRAVPLHMTRSGEIKMLITAPCGRC